MVSTSGCTAIAERVATHLVAKDMKAIEHDFNLFEADLALFRHCLKERGGACEGGTATPLAHSTHADDPAPAVAIRPGASQTLVDSLAELPAGHPAERAHAALSHPVARKAAALHSHLRGHDTGSVSGVAVHTDEGAHGPESTVEVEIKLHEAHDFHQHLLSKTRVILSRVIAGIGPFSLNNASLESFIVELVSTSVRKATEKATWCWYACNLNVDLEQLEADAETAVKDKVQQEAEHVRLRLKISS